MATLRTKRPEKPPFGACEHSQHVEDKLFFIGCFLRQGLGGVGGSSNTRPSHQDDGTRGPQCCPDLVVASLGAQRKDKPGGVVSARVLFDGTHGITVNTRTRFRDQERGPVAADLKRIMREKSRVGVPTLALAADVSEAHRQIPVAEQDWHLLGCQVVPCGSVFMNTVGTFGVASASDYWSRVASAIGGVAQYLAGNTAYTWHMLVVDDYHLDAGGATYRTALFHFFTLCATANVPLSWSKTAGGDVVSWVGFELLHRTRTLGITQRRADWLTKWSREVAAAPVVNMAFFEEGLGRVMYVVSALEYERPFLAPPCRFMTMHPRGSTRRVPDDVRVILNYIAEEVSETRHYPCDPVLRSQTCSFRVDAQASDDRTGVGG